MNELETLTELYHATCRIGLSDQLDDLLTAVLERARALIQFDHCALMLYEPESGRLRVRKVLGYADRIDEVHEKTMPRGHGLSGWAAEHRQAVRVGDVTKDPRYVAGLPDARSSLVVPMIVSNQIAGVFNLESTRHDAFTETHEKLLTVLGSQAGLAILGARARERLQHRIDQLNALYRISQLASGQDDLDTTLTAILGVTEELVPDGHVAVLLLDEATRSLSVRAARGYTEGVHLIRIPVGRGLTGRCAETGEVQLSNDLSTVTDYIEGVPGARSEIALPLKVEGRVIGVLNAESLTPGVYDDEDVQPLTVVAQQAAVVIRAAQLTEEMRSLAITDPLTSLHNRRYFVEKLEAHVRRARRYDEKLVLLLLDCDRLKKINDAHGHLSGDRALQAIADVMKITLRDTDVLARLGGDEFAALLVETDEERGRQVMDRLDATVRGLHLMSEDGGDLDLSISIGLSLFPEAGADAKALLREADITLYRSKRRGKPASAPPAESEVIEFERNRSSGRPGPLPKEVYEDEDDDPREGFGGA